VTVRFDVVALAKRINALRSEYNAAHEDRIPITSAMSRLIENDPDYVPYRGKRRPTRRHRPVTNPRIRTLVSIAAALHTTVGDLLGEPPRSAFTPTELEKVKTILRFLADHI